VRTANGLPALVTIMALAKLVSDRRQGATGDLRRIRPGTIRIASERTWHWRRQANCRSLTGAQQSQWPVAGSGRHRESNGANVALILQAKAEISENDPDFRPFMGINSETISFPFGEARRQAREI